LCWNGEAWKIGGIPVEGNDAQAILDLLFEASASTAGDVQAVLDVLLSIQGPFAFVYFDKPARKVYYGRDRLGRRSLLALHSQDGSSLALSSIADTADSRWEEVDADGVYVLDLAPEAAGTGAVSLLPPARHLYKRMANAPEDFVSAWQFLDAR
jgi:asparagine synthetase B (glutamine-hydrolysing)